MGIGHWVSVPLGSVANYINGRAFKPTEWELSGCPIIRIQNLTKSTDIINYTTKQFETKYYVDNGDILMAWSATLDVFIWNEGPAWLNQHIFNVKEFSSIILRKFLYYTLKQAIADFYLKTHGTGMVHVTKPIFESHIISLPPFNEQKRIVAKLDQIIPRIDAVKERLDKVPTIIKRFRQSVLTAAVTGKLTEQWRDKNSDLSGILLLKKSYEERLAVSKLAFAESTFNGERKPLKPPSFSICDKEGFNIPDSWSLTTPDMVASPERYSLSIGPFGSNLKVVDYQDSGVPLIFVRNIKNKDFSGQNVKYVSEPKASELRAHSVSSFDLLITKMGEPPGDCEVYPENFPDAIITADCLKFRVWDLFFNRMYFMYLIKSFFIKEQLGLITQGVAQQKISLERFKTLKFPVPPLEEQQEIVRQVDKLFAIADKLETHYQKAKARVDKLSQSVLAKAFRGELVMPEAELAAIEGRDFESVEKLLERILKKKSVGKRR